MAPASSGVTEHMTKASSPLSVSRQPLALPCPILLQFSHRFFALVVIYLALTLYVEVLPSKFRSIWGSVPNRKGGGAVSGSTWVLRVACPRVRSRAPPGYLRSNHTCVESCKNTGRGYIVQLLQQHVGLATQISYR